MTRTSRPCLSRRKWGDLRTRRIAAVEPLRYPVLRVTFGDGLSGEYDLSDLISRGPIFEPLKDEVYVCTVAGAPYGHSFGWDLDDPGNEIDFCPDATRIAVETRIVEELAARHAGRLAASPALRTV